MALDRGVCPTCSLPHPVLDDARRAIRDRAETYGDKSAGLARAARLFSVVLDGKLTAPLTPRDVALLMIQMKVSRLIESPDHRDSWVDIAGYAALGGEE